MKEAYCYIHKQELWLRGVQISSWKTSTVTPEERKRNLNNDIKLLLNRAEIKKIDDKLRIKGYTIIPLALLEEKGLVKVKIALVTGKRQWDKRAKLKEQDQKRDLERELKGGKYF